MLAVHCVEGAGRHIKHISPLHEQQSGAAEPGQQENSRQTEHNLPHQERCMGKHHQQRPCYAGLRRQEQTEQPTTLF